MKRSAIKHVALFAALVVSSAANAANYEYTAHYDYIRRPQLSNAQIDSQIHEDTVVCDNVVGVQRGKPSADYRSCMLQQGWKYSYLSRTPSADVTRASGSLLQLRRQASARPFHRS